MLCACRGMDEELNVSCSLYSIVTDLMSHQPSSDFLSTSTTEPMATDSSSCFLVE